MSQEYEQQKIMQVDLEKEMKKSYIDYAMSVIVGRALPDVRDGLKPVHRRILYAMYRGRPDLGQALPQVRDHGRQRCSAATIRTATHRFTTRSWRLAQPFSLHYPLIDGHGNFGSVGRRPPGGLPLHRGAHGQARQLHARGYQKGYGRF